MVDGDGCDMQVIVNEETAHATAEFISKRLSAIKNQRISGEQEDLALVIGALLGRLVKRGSVDAWFVDGKSLEFALEKDISKSFLELALLCKAVICCALPPLFRSRWVRR